MGRIFSPRKLKTVLKTLSHFILLSFITYLIYPYILITASSIFNIFNSAHNHHSELPPISADSSILSNRDDVIVGKQLAANAKGKLCPLVPSTLGYMKPDTSQPASMEEVERTLRAANGAWSSYWHAEGFPLWQPLDCTARHTVAILIPIRNRTGQLLTFLRHMHPFLQRQRINYGIFVVEQSDKGKFNRAKLLNVGFIEGVASFTKKKFDCVVFHDVDHLPEDDRNLYVCPSAHEEAQALQLAVAVDTYNYSVEYADYFGAVSAISRSTFERVNGFSNMYWGWGGEDDDLYQRLTVGVGVTVSRTPTSVGRYTTLAHEQQTRSMARWEMLDSGLRRMDYDGLNSVHYKRLELKQTSLMTHILVDLVSLN